MKLESCEIIFSTAASVLKFLKFNNSNIPIQLLDFFNPLIAYVNSIHPPSLKSLSLFQKDSVYIFNDSTLEWLKKHDFEVL